MCEPMSIVGAGVALAGAAASYMGQRQQTRARQRVINAENQRQANIERQSSALFDQTLPTAGAPREAERRQEAEAERVAEDTAAIERRVGGDPSASVTGSAPQEVGSALARALRNATTAGMDRARRGARLGAYGDAQADVSQDLIRAAQWQQIFGGNATRSAGILPMELERANMRGAPLFAGGQIAQGIGRGVGAWGASGQGPSWGSIFGPSGTGGTY